MTFDFYGTQANAAGYGASTSPAGQPVAAWDGSTYVAAVYSDSAATCWFTYMQDANGAGPGLSQLPSDCTSAYIAARPGGWHLVFQSQSTPSRVSYAQLSDDGTMIVGPVQVSPGDGRSYGAAQVVSTQSGASVFFAPTSGKTAQLFRTNVDTSAKLVSPAAAVKGVVVGSGSYEAAALGGTVAVAWYGRTESPGAAATGTYVTKLP